MRVLPSTVHVAGGAASGNVGVVETLSIPPVFCTPINSGHDAKVKLSYHVRLITYSCSKGDFTYDTKRILNEWNWDMDMDFMQ